VAERHLHVSAGRQIRASDRVHGRLLAFHCGGGVVSDRLGDGHAGGVSQGGWGVQPAEGNADGSGAAVRELAGEEPVCEGDGEREDPPHQESSGASADPGKSGAVLVVDLAGVPGAGTVRELRIGARTHRTLDPVLQPQATASGDRGAVSGGSLFRDRERAAPDDRERRGRERAGAGAAGRAPGAVLHGGADGGAVRGAAGGERQTQTAGGRPPAKSNSGISL
jgi:hypothetical protein